MAQQGKWSFGLFDCFSPLNTCCLGFWCPCVLYGQTHQRVDGVTDPAVCSGSCWAHGCLLTWCNPCQGFLQMSQRATIRRQYGVESNGFNDCILSCCCGCCTLIQEDKEVRSHEGAPMIQKGYVAPNQGQPMVYTQPQQGQSQQKMGV